jgi:hypothetical protein
VNVSRTLLGSFAPSAKAPAITKDCVGLPVLFAVRDALLTGWSLVRVRPSREKTLSPPATCPTTCPILVKRDATLCNQRTRKTSGFFAKRVRLLPMGEGDAELENRWQLTIPVGPGPPLLGGKQESWAGGMRGKLRKRRGALTGRPPIGRRIGAPCRQEGARKGGSRMHSHFCFAGQGGAGRSTTKSSGGSSASAVLP